jgi:hypothetical protein
MSNESTAAEPPQQPDVNYRAAYNDLVYNLKQYYNDEVVAYKRHWDAHESVIDGNLETRMSTPMARDRGRLESRRETLHGLAAFIITATEADDDLYQLVQSGK